MEEIKSKLENQLKAKREILNKLYKEQGLNDFTLKKSQELDSLIAIIQKYELNKYIIKRRHENEEINRETIKEVTI